MIKIRKTFEINYTLLMLAVYFLSMQLRPLFSPNEVLCAEFAREIALSGDWFSLQLNSEIFKPGIIPGVQLSALLVKCFGASRFIVRLLPFVSVCIYAWMLYYFLRSRSYSRLTGQFAVCILLTMPAVFFYGCSAMPDILFTVFTILCYGVLLCCQERYRKIVPSMLVYLISGVIAGIACCLKDFGGLLIPLAAFAIYSITEKRYKELLLFPGIMFIECLVILLCWNLCNPHVEYLHWLSELTAEHTRLQFKLCPPRRILILLAGTLFWLPFFTASCIGLGKKLWKDSTLRFTGIFLCTVLCYFLFIDSSVAVILLIVFPLTILTVAGAKHWLILQRLELGLNIFAIVLLLLDFAAVLLLFCGFFEKGGWLHFFGKDEAAIWLLTIVALCFSGVSLFFMLHEKRLWYKIRCYLNSLFPLFMVVMCIYPRAFIAGFAPSAGLHGLPELRKDTMICTSSEALPDVCWGLKRNDVVLLDSGDPFKEWKRRLGNEKFGSVLLILKSSEWEKGKNSGIFPDDPTWQKTWKRNVPYKIVMYQYNTRELKK
ncbi:MAG: glycosyltransferase family 39 protein [Lentisphaeria bacterium]|nr:glycosyltransferase family 39 protein [Lentisphaeria bacterium]